MLGTLDFARLAKIKSWVFMISRDASAEEATTTGTRPKCSNMRGPCFLAKAWRERWGLEPSWWRFPMIGSFDGEGGMFFRGFDGKKYHFERMETTKMNNGRRIKEDES